jgi:hypothetical protein
VFRFGAPSAFVIPAFRTSASFTEGLRKDASPSFSVATRPPRDGGVFLCAVPLSDVMAYLVGITLF